MAVRLQLKLGAVTEQDRLADSPDTVVVVEPSRRLRRAHRRATCTCSSPRAVAGNRAREATRLVADTIRNEYYYDESAGIRQCLTRSSSVANKRLAHQRDRYGLGHGRRRRPDRRRRWPSSAAASCTWRRSARPRPTSSARPACRPCPIRNRDRGLPSTSSSPRSGAARSRSATRCASCPPNVVAKVGTDALKDALVTLHPAVGDRAPPRPVRRGRRQGQRRRHRVRGDRGRRDAQGQDAGPGPARRAARRRCRTARRSRSPTPSRRGGRRRAPGRPRPRARRATAFERAIWRIQDLLPRRKSAQQAR